MLLKGIRQRGDTYSFTVSMGSYANGKPKRKYSSFKPPNNLSVTKKEKLVNEAYIDFKHRCNGASAYNENMKFSELTEAYFKQYAANKLKEITIYNYGITTKNHLVPRFGNMKLKDITTAMVTDYLTTINLSSATSKKIKIVLQSIMSFAISQKIIKENPCVGALCKKAEASKSKNYLTDKEAKILLSLIDDYTVFNTIIKTLLYTGMRSGECLGLRWNHINFKTNTIAINKTLTYANNRWFLDSPKSLNSIRTIYMDSNLKTILLYHKEQQDKAKRILGTTWQQPDLVFTSCTGHWYDRSLLNTQFRNFLRKHPELTYITIHGLRHTNASLLINAGEDIESISKHLGHANVTITSSVYSHILKESKVRVATTISKVLNL